MLTTQNLDGQLLLLLLLLQMPMAWKVRSASEARASIAFRFFVRFDSIDWIVGSPPIFLVCPCPRPTSSLRFRSTLDCEHMLLSHHHDSMTA